MKRVYVAGPYSADNVLDVFANMRRGMKLSVEVRQMGFAPFSPWMDFYYFLLNEADAFDLQNCYRYSLAWLEVSDAIIFTPDWEKSYGARKEHEFAVKNNIKIFYTLTGLASWEDKEICLEPDNTCDLCFSPLGDSDMTGDNPTLCKRCK